MVGACTNHEDPNLWFPEESSFVGRPDRFMRIRMANRAIKAIGICQTCPIMNDCLQLGMRTENLDHGIWGGLMAGERIILSGVPSASKLRQQAIAFAEGVRTWQSIS